LRLLLDVELRPRVLLRLLLVRLLLPVRLRLLAVRERLPVLEPERFVARRVLVPPVRVPPVRLPPVLRRRVTVVVPVSWSMSMSSPWNPGSLSRGNISKPPSS
jgi:hypothetical protein